MFKHMSTFVSNGLIKLVSSACHNFSAQQAEYIVMA